MSEDEILRVLGQMSCNAYNSMQKVMIEALRQAHENGAKGETFRLSLMSFVGYCPSCGRSVFTNRRVFRRCSECWDRAKRKGARG